MKSQKIADMLRATRLPGAGRIGDAASTLQALVQKGLPAGLPDGLPGLSASLPAGLSNMLRGAVPGHASKTDEHFTAGSFTNAAGTRPYRLYIPRCTLPQHPALVVLLHGCTQSPEDFAAGTRMNLLADRQGFLVLYPGQVSSANANGCWNWFRTSDQGRDAGEPSIIAGMTRMVMAEHSIDSRRVFAAGLSAGGAMAATLGAVYPDLFAAIGIHSGLAHGSAHDMPSAFAAMHGGKAGSGRITVPTIIFQGDSDRTVNVKNAAAIAVQAAPSIKTRREVAHGKAGKSYTRTTYVAAGDKPLLEEWLIHGAGHAWSGGDPAGSYTDPAGPDASAEMLRFFLQR